MKRQHFLWLLGATFASSFIVAACTDDGNLLQPEAPAVPAVSESVTAVPPSPLDAALGTGACMGNDAISSGGLVSGFGDDPLAFNCTAGDIVIANAETASGTPIQCVPGQPINDVDIVADIVQTSQSDRVDIGIWIENGDNGDGGAEDGDCDFFYFDESDVNGSNATDEDSDQCGDLVAKATVEDFELGGLDLVCPTSPVVVDGKTYIEIESCISWTQPGGDRVCPVGSTPFDELDYRHGTLPANKSKCECSAFLVEIELVAQLTLKKNVTNNSGGTAKANEWTLNAGSLINEAGTCTDDGSVCSMALTSTATADPGTGYLLSETGGPTDYMAGSWSCDGGSLVGSTITLAAGDDVICQITNDDIAPTLTLKKNVTNDDGGTAKANQWTLVAGSLINEAGACTDDGSVCSMALTTQTTAQAGVGYALSETGGPSGYTPTSWSCDGGSLVGSTITLGLNEDVTCQITNNDDAPKLKLVKLVDNVFGGTAVPDNWTLSATAPAPDDGRNFSNLGGSGIFETVFASAGYVLDETGGPSGYLEGSWSCDGGNLVGSTVTLGLGDMVTCTITNTEEQPPEEGNSINVRLFELDLDGQDVSGTYGIKNVSEDPATISAITVTAQFKPSGGGGFSDVGVSGCIFNPGVGATIPVDGMEHFFEFDCMLDSAVSGGTLKVTVQVNLFGAPGKDNFKSTLSINI